jgi:hypothetical protein
MAYTPATDPNVNPLGAVAVFDNEAPAIFSARAVETVSGGQFVYVKATDGTLIGSGVNSFATNDLTVAPSVLHDAVNGIALYNVASGTNNYVAVARKGTFIVQATDVVSGGALVVFASGGVANMWSASAGSATVPGAGQFASIGRSLCPADSGGYCLLALNC